ncbi:MULTISPECIES: hypothetical protein [unclassified Pseudomonas]|uniref:hypothetical protein n=1 Tax=unclassified Pseudomonas TaxID=196821 RepID=UPI0011A11948|nr:MULTISPECIES: hypothetical protein [unclassified Pseudomonas]
MEDEVTIEHEGVEYSAPYIVTSEMITVFLPNGEQRSTALTGGIVEESAARTHLRAYVRGITKKTEG